MKLTIKVKRIIREGKTVDLPNIIDKGDWVDLRTAVNVNIKAAQSGTLKRKTKEGVENKYRNITTPVVKIPLGIAMQLPKGFEAILAVRSSTPAKYGIMCSGAIGVIDNKFCGEDDEWILSVIPLRETTIPFNERVCQFRIQLSQKATLWQKIKWFFCSGINIKEVDNLYATSRGGFGSTN